MWSRPSLPTSPLEWESHFGVSVWRLLFLSFCLGLVPKIDAPRIWMSQYIISVSSPPLSLSPFGISGNISFWWETFFSEGRRMNKKNPEEIIHRRANRKYRYNEIERQGSCETLSLFGKRDNYMTCHVSRTPLSPSSSSRFSIFVFSAIPFQVIHGSRKCSYAINAKDKFT